MGLVRRAFTGERTEATGPNVVVAFVAVLLPALALLASWLRQDGAWIALTGVLTTWMLLRALLFLTRWRTGTDGPRSER
jgi:hypothetical protein